MALRNNPEERKCKKYTFDVTFLSVNFAINITLYNFASAIGVCTSVADAKMHNRK